jgi:acetylornithine deacetylase/succinyl-diaminopimelate desuccinylase-like protein
MHKVNEHVAMVDIEQLCAIYPAVLETYFADFQRR